MSYTIYSVLDVTAHVSKGEVFFTMFQKLMFNKQNIILLIYKFTSLLLVSRINM